MLVGAFMKSGAFREEQEWRIVSPPQRNHVEAPIEHRVGRTMLIPYMDFVLPTDTEGRLELAQVIVGPTPTMGESMRSLAQFLGKHTSGYVLQNGLIPYRE